MCIRDRARAARLARGTPPPSTVAAAEGVDAVASKVSASTSGLAPTGSVASTPSLLDRLINPVHMESARSARIAGATAPLSVAAPESTTDGAPSGAAVELPPAPAAADAAPVQVGAPVSVEMAPVEAPVAAKGADDDDVFQLPTPAMNVN